jgi:hypothetical protein
MPPMPHRRGALVSVLLATLATATAVAAAPLSRDLDSYVIFALHDVGLKNISVQGACNTGVDCAHPNPNSSCGIASHENAHYAEGSQIAADRAQFNRPGAAVWELFSNDVTTLANVTVGAPPVQTLSPLPILGDVDGDGKPSCSVATGQCVTDPGDLAAACGFPTPFPACDAANEVLAQPGVDCVRGVDVNPGNGRCDLAPGTYGAVSVQNGGKLTLTGGGYAMCSLQVGQGSDVLADAPSVLDVSGTLALGNDATFGPGPGESCGMITVHASGPGSVTFGRQAKVNGYFCGPERLVRLGHDNDLTGRFFGDVVDADDNNRAFCCTSDEVGVCAAPGPGAPLRRDMGAYFALAQRSMSMKDFQLDAPCNVGVNCGSVTTNGTCGVIAMEDATFGEGSQVVGDKVFFRKPGAKLWQLFRNDGGPLDHVELLAPPETPFAPPIIPGTCDDTCTTNVAAMEAACGFPTPFPACDSTRPVRAMPLADCPFDTTPGNQQCDLAPGVYGRLWTLAGARVSLAPGQYVFCSMKVGRDGTIDAHQATVLLPSGAHVKASNGAAVGADCGDLTVLMQGQGVVSFGRHALIASRVCAPRAYMRLGHGNTLIGQFIGDTISSDSHNQGRCCCDAP